MKMAFKPKEKKTVPIRTRNRFSKLETEDNKEDSDSRATITDHPWRSTKKGTKAVPTKGIKMVLTKSTRKQ
jgi:hypothetical protein